jgi:hypothetical protein
MLFLLLLMGNAARVGRGTEKHIKTYATLGQAAAHMYYPVIMPKILSIYS